MAKIGILGGTFDPVHNGHLALGKQAYEQFKLDEIWFMPSGHPPHKKSRLVTQGKEREDMVKLAIASVSYFVYSDFELKREGNTYTAQTLTLLREAYPQHEFYFIIGADSLYEIEQWYTERNPSIVLRRSHNDIITSFGINRSYFLVYHSTCSGLKRTCFTPSGIFRNFTVYLSEPKRSNSS